MPSGRSREVWSNRARRQSGFPTFIPCQRQDANVLPKRRQSHQGDKLCDVSTVPLVARRPVFLARGSDADGEPHSWCRWRASKPQHGFEDWDRQGALAGNQKHLHYGEARSELCSNWLPYKKWNMEWGTTVLRRLHIQGVATLCSVTHLHSSLFSHNGKCVRVTGICKRWSGTWTKKWNWHFCFCLCNIKAWSSPWVSSVQGQLPDI